MTPKLLPPPAQLTKQVREYLAAVQQGKKSYFVIQSGQHWFVRSRRDLSLQSFSAKTDALAHATAAADRQPGPIFVFDDRGKLIERS